MDTRQFTCAVAHATAAEFVRLGIVVPDKEVNSVAIVEDAGLRVVVSITKYDGPARLYPTPEGAAVLGVPMMPVMPLTSFQQRVLDVLDMTTPRKAVWIAHKLGMKCSGGFRGQLGYMVKAKMIRNEGGYLLCAGQ